MAITALVLAGCSSDAATTRASAGDPSASAGPSSSPTPACDPDAAFLVGAIRTYAADQARLRKRPDLDPAALRVFAGKVGRLFAGVATHPVPNSLFIARDQELQAFTQIRLGALRIASGGAADVTGGKREIAVGEAQLNQVGAALSGAVTACG
jgi:hypothetical protein